MREEINTILKQSVDIAKTPERDAFRSTSNERESLDVVAKTVPGLTEIAQQISIIEEVAHQVARLTWNAAMEDTWDGEHLQRLEMAAAEVRKLAELTHSLAHEICPPSASRVEVAKHAAQILDRLAPEIQKMKELVQEIRIRANRRDVSGQGFYPRTESPKVAM